MEHGLQIAVRGLRVLLPGLVGGGDEAVPVGAVADPAECHGEAALGVRAAPVGGGPPDAGQFGLADVGHAPDPRLVPTALNALHHLAHVAHRASGEREIRYVHHRLVAEFQGVESGLAGPDLAAGLAATHHRGGPGVRPGLVHEAFDGAGPGLHVADRVPAGQHHPGHHAVADGGLAAGGEDHGLVSAEREVAQRVAAAVPLEQGTQLCLVVLGQTGGRVLGPEGEVDRGDGGQQAERAQRVGHGPGGVAGVVDRALEAEQPVQHVLEPVRDAGVPDQAARVDAHDDQAEPERTRAEQDEVRQGPPTAARVGERGEFTPVAHQQVTHRQRDDGAQDRVPVGELGHRTGREQDDGGPPGPALVPLQAVGQEQQQDSRRSARARRRRGRGRRGGPRRGCASGCAGSAGRRPRRRRSGRRRCRRRRRVPARSRVAVRVRTCVHHSEPIPIYPHLA